LVTAAFTEEIIRRTFAEENRRFRAITNPAQKRSRIESMSFIFQPKMASSFLYGIEATATKFEGFCGVGRAEGGPKS
jgi:hypothetical protein